MSSARPRGPAPDRSPTLLLVLLVVVHLALCVALVHAGIGSVYMLQDDVGSVQVLTPFVVGAVLGVAEQALLGPRTAAQAWLLTLAAGLVVAVVSYGLSDLAGDLFLVFFSMATVLGAGLTALVVLGNHAAHDRYL